MPQHADTRLEKAAASSERWAAAARKHREREARARARGNQRSAEMAAEAAVQAERHARANARKVDALEVPAARARVARRLNEENAGTILERAVALAAETPQPAPEPTEQDRRAARLAEQRTRPQQTAEAEEA